MSDPVTFVNVIDVDPSKQQEVIDLLREGAEMVVSKRPGFVSCSLLASLDGTRVINVARWSHADDALATQADPEAAAYAQRVAAIAQPGPGIFAVVAELAA